MPIPKPDQGEKEQSFIARCMGDKNMQEYPRTRGRRYATANGRSTRRRWRSETMEMGKERVP